MCPHQTEAALFACEAQADADLFRPVGLNHESLCSAAWKLGLAVSNFHLFHVINARYNTSNQPPI